MTTVEDAAALVKPPVRTRILERPRATTGVWSWFTTVDHKKIAIMYATTAMFFFVVGGYHDENGLDVGERRHAASHMSMRTSASV